MVPVVVHVANSAVFSVAVVGLSLVDLAITPLIHDYLLFMTAVVGCSPVDLAIMPLLTTAVVGFHLVDLANVRFLLYCHCRLSLY